MIFIAIYRQWNLKSIFDFNFNTAINRVCFKVSKYLECDVGMLRVKS